ncbi:hypothetical protein M128_1362 [Bacteroides fragilis str. S6L8]|nr:hypothetical protein M086_1225 [Bacteroides fragilis str. S13 L11]EYA25925.1 hypothetical protein M103_1535 [Bacteroides fragilis str. 1007-1-F \
MFAIGIIACIAISFITIQAIWIGTACIGPSATIYFSQTSCKYIVKKNGDLQIVNDFFRQKRTFSHITDVTYTRHALGMQKIKIRHATGFVMIDPQSPRELIKALQKTNPDVRVKNFI